MKLPDISKQYSQVHLEYRFKRICRHCGKEYGSDTITDNLKCRKCISNTYRHKIRLNKVT